MLEVDRRDLLKAVMPFVMNDIPVCIQGLTGVGKTQGNREEIFPAFMQAVNMEGMYHDIRVSGMLAEDFTGVPTVMDVEKVGRVTQWARPAFNPIDDGKMHYMVFEEITHNRSVFAPLYRVFSEREDAAGNKLPKHHRLIATCNTKEDKGGDAQLFKPLERRLAWILVKSSNLDTIEYGKERGWDARLLAFLKKYPELNHAPNDEDPAWPNPARWEQVSKFMHLSVKEIENISKAIIGQGPAIKFAAELEAMEVGIPRISDVVTAPMKASVPSDDQHQFIIARMLSRVINDGNCASIVTYLSRLTPDIASKSANEITASPNATASVKNAVKKLIIA
jgi:hypothetical protein